jgi:hypothetical protein
VSSAELAQRGIMTERRKPFSAASIASMPTGLHGRLWGIAGEVMGYPQFLRFGALKSKRMGCTTYNHLMSSLRRMALRLNG